VRQRGAMRTRFIEFIRESWFEVLYVAWWSVPLAAFAVGLVPDWASVAWIGVAVLYLAAGAGILLLMFARRAVRRTRLADLTVARASANSEGIPERLDRYRTRLVWERVDGVLSVALPVVLALMIVCGTLVVLASGQTTDRTSRVVAAAFLVLTVGAVCTLLYQGLSSGRQRVDNVVRKMGHVTHQGPDVAALARELDAIGVAIGARHVPSVSILESAALNAFAVGRGTRDGAIVVTRALADELSERGRRALLVQLTLSLQKRSASVPSDDTRRLTERLIDLETVAVTGEPDGMLEVLRIVSDRETAARTWYQRGNPIPAAVSLVWPLVDLENPTQTADRILALDEALRSEGYYTDIPGRASGPPNKSSRQSARG